MSRKYGKLHLAKTKRRWEFSADPHVMLRAKRVFEKISKGADGVAVISDTPETCRDLRWFMERYPLEITPANLRYLQSQAAEHAERILTMEQIIGSAKPPMAFELAHPARDYQRRAAELYLMNQSLLLGDDVGVGKTVSAICSFTDGRTLPAAVVTLGGVMPKQWADEISRFAPDLFVHVVKKGTPYELPQQHGRSPDVLVLNYHKLAGWAQLLARYCKSVVYDECQELRRSESGKYAAAKLVSKAVNYRIGLSATPIYNFGGEIFNVIECLNKGVLGTRDEFYREWCQGSHSTQPRIRHPSAFGTYLREHFIMLRRTRRDVGRELPALTRIPYAIESDAAALDEIHDTAAELARLILSSVGSARGERMHASEELSNLMRQATGVAKAPYVADFVRLLVNSGERVVLCGWHRNVYSIWQAKLADLKPAFFTGSESVPQKEEAKRRFMAGETPLLILSLRSGAGLDGLQAASSVIAFGELDWSPGVIEQCIGRIHRDGQASPVLAYFLVSETGSDPMMAEVLGLKRDQVEGIRSPDAPMIEQLDAGGGHIRRLAERYLATTQQAAVA